jgi:outer membrane protein OmpA-like peptidoglycan-associated protein
LHHASLEVAMPRPAHALALLGALALLPAEAPAQSTPPAERGSEEQVIIERLTRGIRMPGTDTGTAAPATPAQAPVLVPAAPAPALTPAPAPSPAPVATPTPAPLPPPAVTPTAPASPPQPAPQAAPPRLQEATTAPAGVPAISIMVTFASGSWALSPAAQATLAPLGRALNSPELRPFRFRVEGHTDTVGDPGLNQILSQRRAEAVRDHLAERYGVAPFRLLAVGLGQNQLLVPTGPGVDEPRNRRVQILNLGQ